jgi:hypothetical protein
MFSDRALSELECRRSQLLVAAETHRANLRNDLSKLTATLGWVDRAAAWLPRARPLLWVAAPAAGYLVARRARALLRWLPAILPWWRIARHVAARLGAGSTSTGCRRS